MRKRVIVSAIGGPTGSGIIKCLRRRKDVYVIGLDADANCPLRHQVDEFLICPTVNDEGYVDFVNDIISTKGVSLYYPTLQTELCIIPGISCAQAAPSQDVIKNTLDKVVLYDMLNDAGLDYLVPAYSDLQSLSDFDYFCDLHIQQGNPVCIKMRNGHGGIGFKVLVKKDRLLHLISAGKDRNYYDYKTLREALVLDESDIKNYFVTKYLEGDEVSVDLFAVDGEVKAIVTRKRSRVSNGIVLDGKVEPDAVLMEHAAKISEVVNLTGFSNIQFKYDSSGAPKLIDFNPRFCGSQLISFGAGVNFPYMALCYYHNLPLPEYTPIDQMISKRYWKMKFIHNP